MFVACFLGAVVSLITLGVLIGRYTALRGGPLAGELGFLSAGPVHLLGLFTGISSLSMLCCHSLRRLVNRAVTENQRAGKSTPKTEMLAAIVDASPDAIVVTNQRNIIEFVNPRALEFFGYDEAYLLGQPIEVLVPEHIRERHTRHHEVFFDNPKIRRMGGARDITARTGDGREIPVDICLSPMEIDGEAHAVSIVRDVREPRRLAAQLKNLAFYDSLTGLPNRRAFERNLEAALECAERGNYLLGVLFLDLDGFKGVNDTFGHAAGDQLLRAVAGRLTGNVRANDRIARTPSHTPEEPYVSRLGGDEFTILLSKIRCPEDAERVARRILDDLSGPIVVVGHELYTNVSIGIAVYPRDASEAETLLRNADAAMYAAKQSGRGTYRFYNTSLNANAARRHEIGLRLRTALREGHLRLHYQPSCVA